MQGKNAWYTVAFDNVKVERDDAKYHTDATTFARTEYHSQPLYAQFPEDERVVRAWVSDAATSDSGTRWDTQGSVKCSGLASGIPARRPLPDPPVRDNPPDRTLESPPRTEDAVAIPKQVEAPAGLTACANPFTPAVVTGAVSPQYPEFLRSSPRSTPLTVQVEIAIRPDGSLADAWVWQPSGVAGADTAALSSARASTYRAGTVLCAPAPGTFLFSATFMPAP